MLFLLLVTLASYTFGLVIIYLHTLYFIFIYDDVVCFALPTSTCVISFLSLYICFFMYTILIFV